jgi:hypothetical protein
MMITILLLTDVDYHFKQNGNQHQSATKWQSTSVSNKMVINISQQQSGNQYQ